MVDNVVLSALKQVLAGRAEALVSLADLPHSQLLAASQGEKLELQTEGVITLLLALQAGEINGEQAQQWASFVKNGFAVSSLTFGPILALDIDWELRREQEIADVLARLEEIGDAIDGEVPDHATLEEFQRMLR